MAEPRSTAEEAGDPSTSPERLLELTEKHPQLHRLIVQNPSCPEVARQWILATNPWAKQAYEASRAEEPGAVEADAEDPDEVSVWGDLGARTAVSTDTAPQELPEEAPTAPVRIAENAGVVPLGASAAPAPAEGKTPASPAPADSAAPVHSAAPADSAASAFAAAPAGIANQPAEDDGERSRRRTWWACGGCLVLALLLVLVVALLGRAWLGGDDEEYQRDSSTSAAEESSPPTEQPTEEPTEEETSAEPVSPAPEDAREMTSLRSPTGNISCELATDSVSCSVIEHDYSASGVEGCEDGPFSITVAAEDPARACGSSFVDDSADTLEYDDSAVHGDMACTSRFDGMTCWNTLTGKGFMVNRATYETF